VRKTQEVLKTQTELVTYHKNFSHYNAREYYMFRKSYRSHIFAALQSFQNLNYKIIYY